MSEAVPLIFVTEFKNQFDAWQVFHAYRNPEKAHAGAGMSGRIIKCIEYSAYEKLQARLLEFEGMTFSENEEIKKLRAELERERMRLAACGVIALANTQESARKAREMHPDYESASASDVMRAVDSEMLMREKVKKLKELLLLTDPVVSDVVVGSTQLKQHQEFLNCFPDERKALQDVEAIE